MFTNTDHINFGVIKILIYYVIISTGNILIRDIYCYQSIICLFSEYSRTFARLFNTGSITGRGLNTCTYVYCKKIISRLCSFNGETFVNNFYFVYISII